MKAVEFCGVGFSYGEGGFAISDLDLSLEEGEFVAVLGHNGSGKSTLARLCNGLLEAAKGEVRVFGEAITDKNLYTVRAKVGLVFQNPDNQTVSSIVEDDVAFGAENLGLAREEIARRVDEALAAVDMEKYRTATVSRLSGGQKQRVAIAGVLALRPRVLVLDEATAMLDPRGRREIMDVVRRLNREEGVAVLLVTHFPEEAMMAERAIVMHEGKLVMSGTPTSVFSRTEELSAYRLAPPRTLQICRALRKGGMQIPDLLEEDALAAAISDALRRRA